MQNYFDQKKVQNYFSLIIFCLCDFTFIFYRYAEAIVDCLYIIFIFILSIMKKIKKWKESIKKRVHSLIVNNPNIQK